SNVVSSVYEDTVGDIWIATRGGLDRLRHGKVRAYSAREGLPENTIFHVLEDKSGYLWLTSNRGIFRIQKKQFDDLDTGKIKTLTATSFGVKDGMKSRECNAGKPGAWRAADR